MFVKIFLIVLASLIVIFIVGMLYLIAPKKASKKRSFNINQVKFAHRGLHNIDEQIPENSMAAFRKAIELGYGIELDIRATKDNEIVVFHDDSLKRMCNIEKQVDELDLEELQKIKLLKSNEAIPLLKDVLKLVHGRVPLLVEYKASLPGSDCNGLCKLANEILKNYQGDYAIESFNYNVLRWYKKNMPNILRGQLGMGMQCYEIALGKEEAKKLPMKNRRMVTYLLGNYIGRPHFISYRYQDINLFVKLNQILGAKIACWTVINKVDNEKLLKEYDSVIFERFLA